MGTKLTVLRIVIMLANEESSSLAGTLVIEMAPITMQAARGVNSHFNNATRWAQAGGVGYALLALLLFLWAMAGRPLVSL